MCFTCTANVRTPSIVRARNVQALGREVELILRMASAGINDLLFDGADVAVYHRSYGWRSLLRPLSLPEFVEPEAHSRPRRRASPGMELSQSVPPTENLALPITKSVVSFESPPFNSFPPR